MTTEQKRFRARTLQALEDALTAVYFEILNADLPLSDMPLCINARNKLFVRIKSKETSFGTETRIEAAFGNLGREWKLLGDVIPLLGIEDRSAVLAVLCSPSFLSFAQNQKRRKYDTFEG